MKFIGIFLSIVFLISCQSTEKENATDTQSGDNLSIDIEKFKEYFQKINFDADTLSIHHYKWATEDKDFEGQLIAPELLTQYVDSTIFKINVDEQYYAISYIEQLEGFLVRVKINDADHMQQLFLLTYNTEKQAFINSKKVASFFGAEGFLNIMASWIISKDDTYQVFMRNNNWSFDASRQIETKSDSIRTYVFENHQFTPISTIETSKALKRQFPLEN